MVKYLFDNDKDFSRKFEKLLEKRDFVDLKVDKIVDEIIKNIKKTQIVLY